MQSFFYAMDGSIKRLHGRKKLLCHRLAVLSDYMDVKKLLCLK